MCFFYQIIALYLHMKTSEILNIQNLSISFISNKTKIHIYRILQESLQNIYKHANASHVEISFSLKNNVICIIIKDDGSGFDVNKSRKGIGIKNITSRVKVIQGELKIESQKNAGTSIIITIPA
jgi:two-component system NarL family sensor kinase